MKVQKSSSPERATISHSQKVSTSKNYNSASADYGISFEVANTPEAIAEGFKRAEKIVETRLKAKIDQQAGLLNTLCENG